MVKSLKTLKSGKEILCFGGSRCFFLIMGRVHWHKGMIDD